MRVARSKGIRDIDFYLRTTLNCNPAPNSPPGQSFPVGRSYGVYGAGVDGGIWPGEDFCNRSTRLVRNPFVLFFQSIDATIG